MQKAPPMSSIVRDGSRLVFLGAADTVTGSRYLIETGGRRILVDCGLFQGLKVLRERNRARFPVDPAGIDAVILSHAHLDHSGYLPALVRDGFRGPIFATKATAELCEVMLPDSAHLLEEEAEHARRHRWSKHVDPQPLYTAADADRALSLFRPVPFSVSQTPVPGVTFELVPAGHILGAAQVQLTVGGTRVRFTGDLGRPDDPLMRPPHELGRTDVLVTESTYGDRAHSDVDPEQALADLIRRTVRRDGVVLIPAFTVGRTETVLLHLARLRSAGRIPHVPIFLNSPMAVDVAAIYRRHPEEMRGDPAEMEDIYRTVTMVRTVEESKALNARPGPMIIISASGMLTGGRILHHLVAFGSSSGNAIVLTGFQAAGTRGSALVGGATSLRIFGRDVPILAEVLTLDDLSAHADADELLSWMSAAPAAPAMTFVTHGEPEAADALRARIQRELGWRVRVPEHRESIDLAEVMAGAARSQPDDVRPGGGS